MSSENRVRELRKERGMSQERLAREADVSTGTIQAIERGVPPRLTTAQRIARALKSTVDELFPTVSKAVS